MITSDDDKIVIDRYIEQFVPNCQNKKICIFGCTRYVRDIRDALYKWNVSIYGLIDNDSHKTGKKCLGIEIKLPESYLIPFDESIRIIICSKYYFEMKKQVEMLGYTKENILSIPISESQELNDSVEQMEYDFQKVQEGYNLYKRIVAEHTEYDMVYPCPYPGTGDIYMACSFLPEYLKKNKIKNYLLLVVGNNCMRTARLFEIPDIKVITKNEMDILLKAWEFLGSQKIHLKPLLYWGWRLKKYLYADDYRQVTFREMFQYDVFNLNTEVKLSLFKNNSNMFYTKKMFQENNLKRKKTIIIAPYAGSFVSEISLKVWVKLIKILDEKKYSVCTNCNGDKETALPGTIPISFPYSEAINVLEYAGGFIAVRSGLCDIVSSANCKMAIIYENGFNAVKYDFFSLKKMGLNSHALEWIYDSDDNAFIEKITEFF